MSDTYTLVQETVDFIRSATDFQPRFGIILGTGLSHLADDIQVVQSFRYEEIINFPISTVPSHKGELILGHLDGVPVVAMAGRFHYYEGYSMQEVTFPVRVLKLLGIERLVISNVSGSTNPDYEAGDIVCVRDHINLQPDNPLRGQNDERFGPRFPDMLRTYDRDLNAFALALAQREGIRAHEGVYVALPGPNLETPAEYEFLHRIGGDIVGMSTVPEVLVARHMSLPVFVLSVVSNKSYPIETITETTVEAVIALAQAVEPKMSRIVKGVLHHLAQA